MEAFGVVLVFISMIYDGSKPITLDTVRVLKGTLALVNFFYQEKSSQKIKQEIDWLVVLIQAVLS